MLIDTFFGMNQNVTAEVTDEFIIVNTGLIKQSGSFEITIQSRTASIEDASWVSTDVIFSTEFEDPEMMNQIHSLMNNSLLREVRVDENALFASVKDMAYFTRIPEWSVLEAFQVDLEEEQVSLIDVVHSSSIDLHDTYALVEDVELPVSELVAMAGFHIDALNSVFVSTISGVNELQQTYLSDVLPVFNTVDLNWNGSAYKLFEGHDDFGSRSGSDWMYSTEYQFLELL